MVFNSVKNYYEILNVEFDAECSEIKSAYRKLARIYHPDINKSPEAVEIFKEINIAYETLIDENERKKYDTLHGIFKKSGNPYKSSEKNNNDENSNNSTKTNENKTKNAESASDNSFSSSEKNENKTEHCSNIKKPKVKSKNFGAKNLDFIVKFFKYYQKKFQKIRNNCEFSKPQKGDNITTEVVVTPDEVMFGSKRVVNIRMTRTCPICNGHRFTRAGKCACCNGKGTIVESKKITVTIPKGVKDGAKLRLKGEGASGKNGGVNGDVLIVIRIETKTKVRFDKLNIYYNVPVTPFEAALGEEISIPAFDGTINLKLPKNTSSGQKFRIAGQGIKKNGKIGDLIVTISIEFSHNLSDDEIKLYKQLKKISNDDVRKNFGYGN